MRLTIDTVEANLLLGMALVLIVLIFFLVSVRAAMIVALTIPLALLFSFIFLHARGVAANLLSIGAIDFGIIIDGTLVMVENIFRELGLREGQEYDLHEVILAAAKDVDRPIFYSVAVIIAGYIPIYALSGPSGKLFHPMADTMSIALIGALILTLTFVPVMCSYWFKNGVRERVNKPFEWVRENTRASSTWCLDHPKTTMLVATVIFGADAAADSVHRRRIHAAPGRRRAVGSRHDALHDLVRGGEQALAAGSRHAAASIRWSPMSAPNWAGPTTAPIPPAFSIDEFYVGLKPYEDATWKTGAIHNKAELTEDIQKQLRRISRNHLQLHAAGRRRRG